MPSTIIIPQGDLPRITVLLEGDHTADREAINSARVSDVRWQKRKQWEGEDLSRPSKAKSNERVSEETGEEEEGREGINGEREDSMGERTAGSRQWRRKQGQKCTIKGRPGLRCWNGPSLNYLTKYCKP